MCHTCKPNCHRKSICFAFKCGKGRTVRMPCLWNDIRLLTFALSSPYLIAFCRQKFFNNVTTEEKSFICQKNVCFATDFSPDFVNREALTRW